MSSVKISDRKRYWQFLWRSWAIQDSWNYERQMNMGFLFGIAPTLDRLYPDDKDPQQLAHNHGVHQVVELLEQQSKQGGQGKAQDQPHGAA